MTGQAAGIGGVGHTCTDTHVLLQENNEKNATRASENREKGNSGSEHETTDDE